MKFAIGIIGQIWLVGGVIVSFLPNSEWFGPVMIVWGSIVVLVSFGGRNET